MRDLRARCEWDAEQTHESLRPYLIEEAHELDEAIRSGDDAQMREELGDVVLQVLFHSVMAEERDAFTFEDVTRSLIAKMKGRHPHLYGDSAREPWERMKSKKRSSLAEGLPASLPSLRYVAVSRAPVPIPDEEAPYATELVGGWPYYLSKIYQEKLAFDLGRLPSAPIVLLSMCESAQVTPSGDGFVMMFLQRGARAAIGTSTTQPWK